MRCRHLWRSLHGSSDTQNADAADPQVFPPVPFDDCCILSGNCADGGIERRFLRTGERFFGLPRYVRICECMYHDIAIPKTALRRAGILGRRATS